MSMLLGFLLLLALVFWTMGVLRIVHWILDWRDARRLAAYRADQMVAQASRDLLGGVGGSPLRCVQVAADTRSPPIGHRDQPISCDISAPAIAAGFASSSVGTSTPPCKTAFQRAGEHSISDPCDTTVAAEQRADQMADATSGYYFDPQVRQ